MLVRLYVFQLLLGLNLDAVLYQDRSPVNIWTYHVRGLRRISPALGCSRFFVDALPRLSWVNILSPGTRNRRHITYVQLFREAVPLTCDHGLTMTFERAIFRAETLLLL